VWVCVGVGGWVGSHCRFITGMIIGLTVEYNTFLVQGW
jgi:hypothetical protein